MVRFTAHDDEGRTIIGLGLTSENVSLMAQGKPVHVTAESLGLKEKVDVVVFYGRSLKELNEQLAPLIGENTEVRRDETLGELD